MKPLKISPLKAFEVPLAGVHLIEASAGTGKTWTLETLFLRLLMEARPAAGEENFAPHAVDRILVVTFAKAATAELRERVRRRLAAALAAETDLRCDHALKLTAALRGFDQAAIYTIHSFCQRVLQEAAFDSGAAFD